MNIRKVTPSDLEAVAKVEADCFPAAEAAPKEVFAERIQAFPHSFFVAEVDGEVVGFINGGVTDDETIADELYHDTSLHDPAGSYQAVFGLNVIAAHRKKGIAAHLVQHFIDAARLAGRKGVILTCKEHMIPYYKRLGFIEKGLSESAHGGSVWYDMMLEF